MRLLYVPNIVGPNRVAQQDFLYRRENLEPGISEGVLIMSLGDFAFHDLEAMNHLAARLLAAR